MWDLSFISRENFKTHVRQTVENYGDKLISYDLKKFNSNLVDPIKLILDKNIYHYSWEETIKNEIARQRDKSTNNDIGYFHQRIFQYMKDCTVPREGWDVIFSPEKGINLTECGLVKTIYVEMKNKHNTMNSASSAKTYMKMQGQLLRDDDCACFLVEAIAKCSQNIPWAASVDGIKQKHRKIRRVSMDEFYKIVTGQEDAFYQMCLTLPEIIQEVIEESESTLVPRDTVIYELNKIAKEHNNSFAIALYLLGFESYIGF